MAATFVAELASLAAARLPEGQGWQISGLPTSTGKTVAILLRTDYVNVGHPVGLPGLLRAQVRGEADDIEQAIRAFGQVLNLVTPIISVTANAHVPEFEYDLIYDSTPGAATEHRLLQWFRQKASKPLIRRQQMILPALTLEVINKVVNSTEGARAHRACVQYQEALGSWTASTHLRAVMHLWMAVEALTKACLRTECQRHGVDEAGLCAMWGIDRKALDGEVRRRLIFHSDDACYQAARTTSDGLEHMFDDFPDLHARAQGCRDCAAVHVRRAIFELIGVEPGDLATLTSMPYLSPVSLESADRVIHAVLIGDGEHLAQSGMGHPMLDTWIPEIRSVQLKGDGYEVEVSDTHRWALGPDVHARITGVGTNLPATEMRLDVLKRAPTQPEQIGGMDDQPDKTGESDQST